MENETFNHYDNPKRARRVYEAYLEDIKEEKDEIRYYFLLNAEESLTSFSRVWDLDCDLIKLIAMARLESDESPLKQNELGKAKKQTYFKNSDGNWSHVDLDATGSWGPCVKKLEDLR